MADAPLFTQFLRQYGLESLVKGWTDLSERDASDDEMLAWLYQQPAFRKRFRGLIEREKAGLPPISIDESIAYETQVMQDANMYGLKITMDEIQDSIAANRSANEMRARIEGASIAMYSSPAAYRQAARRLHGVTDDDLIRFWLSPKEQLPVIQAKWAQAIAAGQAELTGFGQINQAQAQRLQEAGLEEGQLTSGFGTLVQQRSLFKAIDRGEQDINQDTQIGALAGDALALRTIEQRALRRRALFGGTGGYATGNEGVAGVGSAS